MTSHPPHDQHCLRRRPELEAAETDCDDDDHPSCLDGDVVFVVL